jgi:hypothetical protein
MGASHEFAVAVAVADVVVVVVVVETVAGEVVTGEVVTGAAAAETTGGGGLLTSGTGKEGRFFLGMGELSASSGSVGC